VIFPLCNKNPEYFGDKNGACSLRRSKFKF